MRLLAGKQLLGRHRDPPLVIAAQEGWDGGDEARGRKENFILEVVILLLRILLRIPLLIYFDMITLGSSVKAGLESVLGDRKTSSETQCES